MNFRQAVTFTSLTFCILCSARAAGWETVASPNAGKQANTLLSVDAGGDTDVWAAGASFNGRLVAYRTLTEHWDGSAWSLVPSPNATTGYNLLNGIEVAAANDVWAVGQAANGNIYQTLVEHWNGTAWSIVPSPNVIGGSSVLQAISVVSLTAWSIVPSPNDSTDDNILFGVAAVVSNDVWAVGNAGSLKTLAIHWDGVSWSVVPTPPFNSNTSNEVLVGIVALSSDNIWSVGQFLLPLQGSAQQTLTENWDGSSWSVVPSPNAKHSNNRLHGITATPNGTLWAVGTTGVFTKPERTLVLRKIP